MKKLFIIAALLGSATLSHAQDFGKTLITGAVSYSSSKTENGDTNFDSKNSTFSLNPKVGFFVSPRFAIGVSAGYESRSTPQLINLPIYNGNGYNTAYVQIDYETKTFNVGPFVRLYQPVGNKAAFFGQANAYYSSGKSEYEDTPNVTFSTYSNKGGGVSLAPGFVFFPTNTLGLELTMGNIGYTMMKSEPEGSDSSTKTSSFNANLGLSSVSLGVSLYLGRSVSE
ncbi:hypothetical protein EFA69_02515 [Rufibacter immobilis]|uniref:Outer membrane protein beta-barrel domain-containing protein n=1 Tax=Rufibacter immobilis TaxID=1348778 RepID=A0A3M9N390_9BACT|nr:outer membrane beta-barrel protein [Rufibacter immobilis]RNI32219.1 hypothetical protein EFA69_02515 [Rufibacter immobilis]